MSTSTQAIKVKFGRIKFSKMTVRNLLTKMLYSRPSHVTKLIKSLTNFINQKVFPMYVLASYYVREVVNSM